MHDFDDYDEKTDDIINEIKKTDFSWMDKDAAIEHYTSTLINWQICIEKIKELEDENKQLKKEIDFLQDLLDGSG